MSLPSIRISGASVHEGIASVDLQNPSDALEILAQVADGESTNKLEKQKVTSSAEFGSVVSPEMGDFVYQPLQEGLISCEMIFVLFKTFEQDYHPFFPIPPRSTFEPQGLPRLSRVEPHLFSAILTIASQENERVHQVCHDHMQQLVSTIVSGKSL